MKTLTIYHYLLIDSDKSQKLVGLVKMELQKTKHQMKLEQWKRIVYECRNSGLAVKTWCEENRINVSTYYRWQKKVWDSGIESSELALKRPNEIQFAEYHTTSIAGGTAVILHFGEITVEIQNGAERETIESTIHALKKLC